MLPRHDATPLFDAAPLRRLLRRRLPYAARLIRCLRHAHARRRLMFVVDDFAAACQLPPIFRCSLRHLPAFTPPLRRFSRQWATLRRALMPRHADAIRHERSLFQPSPLYAVTLFAFAAYFHY